MNPTQQKELLRYQRALLWRLPLQAAREALVPFYQNPESLKPRGAYAFAEESRRAHLKTTKLHRHNFLRLLLPVCVVAIIFALKVLYDSVVFIHQPQWDNMAVWSLCLLAVVLFPFAIWFLFDRGLSSLSQQQEAEMRQFRLAQTAVIVIGVLYQILFPLGVVWLSRMALAAGRLPDSGKAINAFVAIAEIFLLVLLLWSAYQYFVRGSAPMLGIIAQAFALKISCYLFFYYSTSYVYFWEEPSTFLLYPFYLALLCSVFYYLWLRKKRA